MVKPANCGDDIKLFYLWAEFEFDWLRFRLCGRLHVSDVIVINSHSSAEWVGGGREGERARERDKLVDDPVRCYDCIALVQHNDHLTAGNLCCWVSSTNMAVVPVTTPSTCY